MKQVAQFTQDELVQLIAEKLSKDGLKVIPRDYTVQFVTDAEGKTSALVTGVVQEPVPEEGGEEQTPAQAALDVLMGDGGVMGRGDALGSAVSSGKKRRRG